MVMSLGGESTKAPAGGSKCCGTKIAALDLQEFSTEDRDMILPNPTLKNMLEEALLGASNQTQ